MFPISRQYNGPRLSYRMHRSIERMQYGNRPSFLSANPMQTTLMVSVFTAFNTHGGDRTFDEKAYFLRKLLRSRGFLFHNSMLIFIVKLQMKFDSD